MALVCLLGGGTKAGTAGTVMVMTVRFAIPLGTDLL